jgi:hypothetical protein
MTIYTRIEIGVSFCLALNYKNIELIHKFFNMRGIRIFIYGFLESDYLEYGNYDNDIKDNFDSGILNELVECTNEEEFKLKAANLAEIRAVNEPRCKTHYFLRRRKEFADLEDDDYKNFLDSSEIDGDEEEDDYTEKIDLNEKEIRFEFFKKSYDIHTQCSGYSDYGTSYSSNVYSLKQLSQKNKSAINFFKNYNIDEDKINTEDGVSCCFELNYKNIEVIHKLFKMRCTRKYIHGFLESGCFKYGDYDSDIKDNFDWGILDELVESTNEEEFKLKAANLAEIRTIDESKYGTYYFLRRRKEFADLEDDDYRNFLDISEQLSDEEDDEDNEDNEDYEDDKYTEKIDLNEKKISFEFFYEDSDDEDSDDEYFSKDSLDEIQDGINFFKEFGIHGDEVKISKYIFFES